MSSDSENDIRTPSENVISIDLLQEKSRKKYEAVYKAFMDWRTIKNISSFAEGVLLTYFEELSEKYKSSSLWALYSMLRGTLYVNHAINIENYSNLRAFLKRKSKGYRAKKAKTFTSDEINRFINEAPDDKYLATKVALIMGLMGGCRTNELHSMNIEDFQDLGSAMLVTVPRTKTETVRKFTITDRFYEICKKYVGLRPSNSISTSFFLNYQHGKCTVQNIGINKFGAMAKQIAIYLNLPNPGMYTGHSLRRSSTPHFVEISKRLPSNITSPGQQANKSSEGESMKSFAKVEGIRVGIIHPEYPQSVLTNDQLDVLQRAIMKAVEQIPDNGPQVRFQDCTHRTGWLCITCTDETSVSWLEDAINILHPWEGARLKLVQERDVPMQHFCVEAYIPDDAGSRLSSEEVLTRLRKMNHGLCTRDWIILNHEESGPGQIWTFSIDEMSMGMLEQLDNRPYFGFGQVQFLLKVKEEDVPVQLSPAMISHEDIKPLLSSDCEKLKLRESR